MSTGRAGNVPSETKGDSVDRQVPAGLLTRRSMQQGRPERGDVIVSESESFADE